VNKYKQKYYTQTLGNIHSFIKQQVLTKSAQQKGRGVLILLTRYTQRNGLDRKYKVIRITLGYYIFNPNYQGHYNSPVHLLHSLHIFHFSMAFCPNDDHVHNNPHVSTVFYSNDRHVSIYVLFHVS